MSNGSEAGYIFDNHSAHAKDQHQCLTDMLDPFTTARLEQTGITPGWNCLEVGAGGGSVAVWMAERVAPSGTVLATDIKPVHIPERPGLLVREHDIVHDPLPDNAFHVIHARLVLLNLPERLAVLDRLVRALRPGGWLQLDEFDITYGPALLMPDARARKLYETFLTAKARLFEKAGADGAWGCHAAAAMRDAGLAGIDPQPHLQLWRAGSPGTRLLIHHTFRLRDAFVEVGMTDRQLAEVRELLSSPEFMASSCVIYSVQGRKPVS